MSKSSILQIASTAIGSWMVFRSFNGEVSDGVICITGLAILGLGNYYAGVINK